MFRSGVTTAGVCGNYMYWEHIAPGGQETSGAFETESPINQKGTHISREDAEYLLGLFGGNILPPNVKIATELGDRYTEYDYYFATHSIYYPSGRYACSAGQVFRVTRCNYPIGDNRGNGNIYTPFRYDRVFASAQEAREYLLKRLPAETVQTVL
jgi:hypothetical protein